MPWVCLYYMTLPNCKLHDDHDQDHDQDQDQDRVSEFTVGQRFYPLTFFISIIWILGLCYLKVLLRTSN